MKKVLLLTDFSDTSKNAMHYALNLFKEDTCIFYVLHVQKSTSYTTDDLMLAGNESIYNSIVKDVEYQLDGLVSALKKKFNNVNFKFETLIDYDVLTDAIDQVVSSKHIDVLVMGSNGVSGAKEVVFGSNTINVIRKVECTTLVIPEGFTYKKPQEVLLPLDSLDTLGGKAFSKILQFVKMYSNKLHVLRINENGSMPDAQINDLEHMEYFSKDFPSNYHIVNNVPMHYAVSGYIQTNAIDLTILIEQKELLLERFFMGSTTTKIGNNLEVPLLVFHSK
ncbi:universal stress protein [Psychroserpens sp. AS72]|uniref:universal stress protein n=1 Tax=Psychroserpens sp. AS72 TaxID=3135775 RepID=UPI00317C47BB